MTHISGMATDVGIELAALGLRIIGRRAEAAPRMQADCASICTRWRLSFWAARVRHFGVSARVDMGLLFYATFAPVSLAVISTMGAHGFVGAKPRSP